MNKIMDIMVFGVSLVILFYSAQVVYKLNKSNSIALEKMTALLEDVKCNRKEKRIK